MALLGNQAGQQEVENFSWAAKRRKKRRTIRNAANLIRKISAAKTVR